MTARWLPVARRGDLAPGEVRAIDLGGRAAILYRDGDAYFAAQRTCPHAGFDLAEGFVSRGFLVCPLHRWRFHAATGAFEDWPETCLVTYAVRTSGDAIEVDPTPRRLAPPTQGDAP